MNYQKMNSNSLENTCYILDCRPEEVTYYAWPQMFPTTSGPFGGFAGQAFSTFTIEAYCDGRDALLVCNGKVWKRIQQFDPYKAINGEYR